MSGLAYIPTCRSPSPQIVYNTGRACGGLFGTRCATVRQVCRTGLIAVKRVIDFSIFNLGGLPRAKGHQKGRLSTIHLRLRSYKISVRSRKRSTRYALPNIFTFWLRGLTPGPKFTKRGDHMLATHLRHSAKFHDPTSTHARDIRYKNSADKQKKQSKKTNKYAS